MTASVYTIPFSDCPSSPRPAAASAAASASCSRLSACHAPGLFASRHRMRDRVVVLVSWPAARGVGGWG
jgi:hypothetical protein